MNLYTTKQVVEQIDSDLSEGHIRRRISDMKYGRKQVQKKSYGTYEYHIEPVLIFNVDFVKVNNKDYFTDKGLKKIKEKIEK